MGEHLAYRLVGLGPSIHEFLLERLGPDGRLAGDGDALPDRTESTVRWAPGAMDGVGSHHSALSDGSVRADEVATALLRACRLRSSGRLRALYEAAAKGPALQYLDALPERLRAGRPDHAVLHELGRWLATSAPDREPAKLGIALLGLTGVDPDLDVVRTLGAHDEFTLYCAVACANGLPDPEPALWALARSVDGWGRIHCVERLRSTTDPAIRAWLLQEGFRNDVMDEYLAFIAATTGGLLEALRKDPADREVLTAAGYILRALFAGGPAEDIDDYDEGADAVEAYLGVLRAGARTVLDYLGVAEVRGFLAQDDGWDERAVRGWTATRRQVFEDVCDEILRQPAWDEVIAADLRSGDRERFGAAVDAARRRGMDVFPHVLEAIRAEPLGTWWRFAWEDADRAGAEQLVALAREVLPSGEADGRAAGNALVWTLHGLGRFPGVGGDLLLTGLRSPRTADRLAGLRSLGTWPRARWPEGLPALIGELAASDPDQGARAKAAELLEG